MTKLRTDIRIPDVSVGAAVTAIRDEFRRHATQVGLVSEGSIEGHYNARSSIPTGPAANADKVWKKPVIAEGASGAKYIVIGWIGVGDPAAWQEMRVGTTG